MRSVGPPCPFVLRSRLLPPRSHPLHQASHLDFPSQRAAAASAVALSHYWHFVCSCSGPPSRCSSAPCCRSPRLLPTPRPAPAGTLVSTTSTTSTTTTSSGKSCTQTILLGALFLIFIAISRIARPRLSSWLPCCQPSRQRWCFCSAYLILQTLHHKPQSWQAISSPRRLQAYLHTMAAPIQRMRKSTAIRRMRPSPRHLRSILPS
jgi:hypothetical protein